ncbi:recombinase family protein [Acetobacter sp.]|jgi:DNA invertase Pin-like site-specific DNA recombinase|uniref:recombinase family protein n=1 Tax=Acetobacter sp. TaxID=440 RepID=UPI0025C73D8B|nr:recombinase family protein [Acetobacter sp.]MCH4092156.1 recombinase family protein [Acetobacter sp.]MCI1299927.1 recombinase family protein [Acetobacter sp.]MCI1315945.1 recombinase family protein [Acetobacter sp.]
MRYGYARVSTTDQSLELQEETLRKAGCEIIRGEKVSGSSRTGRNELDILLQFLRPGDSLVVTRIDRLARSISDLQDIMRTLEQKNVSLICTEQPIDTSNAIGKAFLNMLGVFAQFENELRRERQLEGIAKAKGVYKGRKQMLDHDRVKVLKAQGRGVAEIMRQTGISKTHVYCILNHNSEQNYA